MIHIARNPPNRSIRLTRNLYRPILGWLFINPEVSRRTLSARLRLPPMHTIPRRRPHAPPLSLAGMPPPPLSLCPSLPAHPQPVRRCISSLALRTTAAAWCMLPRGLNSAPAPTPGNRLTAASAPRLRERGRAADRRRRRPPCVSPGGCPWPPGAPSPARRQSRHGATPAPSFAQLPQHGRGSKHPHARSPSHRPDPECHLSP
ncbi:hypothetical protein BS78_03G406200 [Paspalum vaginatum]|nr:hypothetical protein BS78_03G406200 [Paspalum vaginatum]